MSDPEVYEKVDSIPWSSLFQRLQKIVSNAQKSNFINPKVVDYLLQFHPERARVCTFYLIPKIHKTPLKGHPICFYCGYMLEPASKWLHHKLLPILLEQPHHLPDSLALIKMLHETPVPPDSLLFTFDVESLYPSIPTTFGLVALEHFITGYFSPGVVQFILELANTVLTCHFLEFNGNFARQKRGTAMGSNFVVVYGCLSLCYLELQCFDRLPNLQTNLCLYKRYINDAFGVWKGNSESLQTFLNTYGTLVDSINITSIISSSEVNILDVLVIKPPSMDSASPLDTKLFQKAMNVYQYIPYSSFHPQHQKKAFIVSELHHLLIRETKEEGFSTVKHQFFHRLRARGYPAHFLFPLFAQVVFQQQPALLQKIFQRLATHQPGLKKSPPILLKLYDYHFSRELKLSKFLLGPLHELWRRDFELCHIKRGILCWRNGKNLKNYLCRSRVSATKRS